MRVMKSTRYLLLGIVGVIGFAAFALSSGGQQTNVYEKIRSFSCRISPASGDLQLAWSDEPPNKRELVNFEGGYAILLNFAARDLPLEVTQIDSTNPELKILAGEEDVGLSVSLEGRDIPVKTLLVIDPTGGRNFSRPISQIEIQSILGDIKNNIVGCIKRPMYNMDIRHGLLQSD